MFRQHVYRSSLVAALALLAAAAVVPSSDLGAQRPRFFSDDPLQREPETQDASKVEAWDIGLTPDLLHNLFGKPGDRAANVRAQNVNTADEVPDSSWFTNRIYAKPLSTDDVTRGPTDHRTAPRPESGPSFAARAPAWRRGSPPATKRASCGSSASTAGTTRSRRPPRSRSRRACSGRSATTRSRTI